MARRRWPNSTGTVIDALPGSNEPMATTGDVVRLAALSDIHYSKNSQGSMQSLFAQAAEAADIMLLCGDLTDYGQPEEARILAKDLTATVKIPIVGVLG